MSDPREKKLPKWAQELLYKERLKNVKNNLCPSYTFSKPDWTAGANGFLHGNEPPKGQILYLPQYRQVLKVVYDGDFYIVFGASRHRASGPYFKNRDDALNHMIHRCAKVVAAEILRVEELKEKPHE